MTELRIAASNIGWSEDDDDRVMRRMSELGFVGLEIAPTRVFADSPYSRADDFAAWSAHVEDEHGLTVCSMQSIWRGRTESIFDDDGASALLDYTSKACDFAKAGGVGNLVFGCPSNRRVPEDRDSSEAIGFLRSCGELASGANTIFALEANPPIYNTNFLNITTEVIDLLEEIGHAPGLGLNLDVGAMVCAEEDVNVVERALPYVSHVHISEPQLVPVEPRDLHRELRDVLEGAEYRGYVSLEMGCTDYTTACGCLEYMAETFLG